MALGALGIAACGSDKSAPAGSQKETPSGGSIAINAAANDPGVQSPFDATPSPDGKTVYFTALREESGERVPGVFKVPAGGGDIEVLASGDTLASPIGITISLDGATL